MKLPLTSPSKEHADYSRRAKPGMAHLEGSGPSDMCCYHCLSFDARGYYSRMQGGMLKPAPCLKFKRMMNLTKDGPAIDPRNRSCKYFDLHPSPPRLSQ